MSTSAESAWCAICYGKRIILWGFGDASADAPRIQLCIATRFLIPAMVKPLDDLALSLALIDDSGDNLIFPRALNRFAGTMNYRVEKCSW